MLWGVTVLRSSAVTIGTRPADVLIMQCIVLVPSVIVEL